MNSTFKDFGDYSESRQRRDDALGAELEAHERREMQDWHLCNGPCAWPDEYEDPPVGPLIEFEESCIAGRGDLLHLVEAMIRRKADV